MISVGDDLVGREQESGGGSDTNNRYNMVSLKLTRQRIDKGIDSVHILRTNVSKYKEEREEKKRKEKIYSVLVPSL